MDKLYDLAFDQKEQLSLFGSDEDNYQNEIDILLDQQPAGLFSDFKNSMIEYEQILANFTDGPPLPSTTPPSSEQNLTQCSQKHQNLLQTEEQISRGKKKKIKKLPISPFHNYQKHLNIALKKLIIVPEFQPYEQLYKIAAFQIWTAYQRTQIKTKRILHFIFNQNNQYKINYPQLKTYGLWTIYHTFGEEIISQAKNYLSKLAINQLEYENIERYLKTRKIQSKDGFKEYIIGFRSELESGYLKRRVNSDKTN